MARIPTCICPTCNSVGVFKLPMPDSGGNGRYLCNHHARHMDGYSFENEWRMGNKKVHEFTVSWENETMDSTLQARAELVHFGFIPTRDCTVQCEYKSPIYEGFPALSKQLVTIEGLVSRGEVRITEECGSHIHIGHWEHINPKTMRYIRRFNNSLFVPLSNAIMADVEKSARFFGRQPNGWAEPVTMRDPSGDYEGWQMKHEAMFNLQHDWTVEFRQAKFVSAKQYMQVAHFARDVVNAIIENFVKHFNDEPADRRRYPNKTAYRKHKADVTANKLVMLYEKYTRNV